MGEERKVVNQWGDRVTRERRGQVGGQVEGGAGGRGDR